MTYSVNVDDVIRATSVACPGCEVRVQAVKGDPFSVVIVEEYPQRGYSSFMTVGLGSLNIFSGKKTVFMELAAIGVSGNDDLAVFLREVGVLVIKAKIELRPGAVIKDMAGKYGVSASQLPHLYVVQNQYMGDLIDEVNAIKEMGESELVDWVQVLPASQAEIDVRLAQGGAALMAMFDKDEADLCDWKRPSVA